MTFNQPHNDPQNYYWFPSGFSREELDRIYRDVAELAFDPATITNGIDQGEHKKIRSSSIKWIPRDGKWNWLYSKLMDQASEANNALWNFDLISASESIQYTEYYSSEDGHYDWHQDIGGGSASHRKVSITVQLSDPDEYEGGDLELWQGASSIQRAPRGAGVVFIFPSYMMHRVTKVTRGTRRSFVLWVGGSHYK